MYRLLYVALFCTHPAFLGAPGQHHNVTDVLLPDHPPEIVPRGGEGSLGHDVLSLRGVTLNKDQMNFNVAVIVPDKTFNVTMKISYTLFSKTRLHV